MSLIAKDFVPEKTKGGMFKSGKMQTFQEVLDLANNWISENPQFNVVNVETVLLPNIHEKDEDGSTDTELWTAGESSSNWYQIVRVWYKDA